MIGLGISDEKGISLEGLELVQRSDIVLAEFFTSILAEGSIRRLEGLAGRKIDVLDRKGVEDEDRILKALEGHGEVSFLTAGDPLTATTHQEIRLRAMESGHHVRVIHSASIYVAAAGAAGLQHYKFGRTTTIPFPEGEYLPTSPLEIILDNNERGLHTLALLDIQADKGRYMTCSEACYILLTMAEKIGTERFGPDSMVVGVARCGREDVKVLYETVEEMVQADLGPPPHSLIVPGKLHFMEEDLLGTFRI